LSAYRQGAGRHDKGKNPVNGYLSLGPGYRRLVGGESDFDPIRSDQEFQALCRGQGLSTSDGVTE